MVCQNVRDLLVFVQQIGCASMQAKERIRERAKQPGRRQRAVRRPRRATPHVGAGFRPFESTERRWVSAWPCSASAFALMCGGVHSEARRWRSRVALSLRADSRRNRPSLSAGTVSVIFLDLPFVPRTILASASDHYRPPSRRWAASGPRKVEAREGSPLRCYSITLPPAAEKSRRTRTCHR